MSEDAFRIFREWLMERRVEGSYNFVQSVSRVDLRD